MAQAPQSSAKVLLLTQFLQIGGLERMLLNLAVALQQQGAITPVVCSYDHTGNASHADLVPQLEQAGVATIQLRKGQGFSPRIVLSLAKIVREQQIQILHSHDLGALIYAALTKLYLLGSVRLIHTQHSLVNLPQARRNGLYQRLFSFLVNHLVCVSEATLEEYRRVGCHAPAASVIGNGIESPPVPILDRATRLSCRQQIVENELPTGNQRAALAGYRDAIWLLYLARLHPAKGQLHLLALWDELEHWVRERSVLLIIGPEAQVGEHSKVAARIARAKNPERIFLLGGTTKSSEWRSSADIALSCSEFEGMPLAPLESMAFGLPQLLSDIPGHRFLANRVALYPLEDPHVGAKLLATMVQELDSPSGTGLSSRAENAAWVRSHFSVTAMAASYQSLYESGGNQ